MFAKRGQKMVKFSTITDRGWRMNANKVFWWLHLRHKGGLNKICPQAPKATGTNAFNMHAKS
jgi:hypothetical protein